MWQKVIQTLLGIEREIRFDDVLDTKPSFKPRSVKVTMPEMLVNNRFVRFRKPFAERLSPFPQPTSTSAQPSADVSRRKETLTVPEPLPL